MGFGSLDGLMLLEINQDLYRNIVSLRESQDLLDDLSDDPADWQAAVDLELQHKPIQFESHTPVIDRPFEDAEFISAVRFPFDNWTQSRFSRGQFGVWYGSPELETTIYETAYHWRNGFLADAGLENQEGISVERRVHLVHCSSAIINLLPKTTDWPELQSNDYTYCQVLGEKLHREGHPGLWTPSARCDGTNAAIFAPQVLTNPRTCCYLTYCLEGGEVAIKRELNSVLLRIE
jgi:hypothetical protein